MRLRRREPEWSHQPGRKAGVYIVDLAKDAFDIMTTEKIGMSRDIDQRQQALGGELVKWIPCCTQFEAAAVEAALHYILQGSTNTGVFDGGAGEQFLLSESQLANLCELDEPAEVFLEAANAYERQAKIENRILRKTRPDLFKERHEPKLG